MINLNELIDGKDVLDDDIENNEQNPNTGNIPPKKSKHKIHCLDLIGQIEGHVLLPPQNKATKYEHVIPQLVSLEEDLEVEGLLITLNTVGGDVEAGLAIAEMIATMSKPSVSLVIGGGHSIGVPIAVAADHSFITQSATMTIHPVRMNGVVIGASQTYEYFERVQRQVISFIARRSGVDSDKLRQLMLETSQISNDMGTILFGYEAVEQGIIDSVGGVSDAMSKLYELIEAKTPDKEAKGKSKKAKIAKKDKTKK
ncbi:MAG: ATP-dependent Clp protease proteolytic subunit [Clostridiales bacterium]|nr:ATP-dependent Clp protease proteolytic subunit [Clostridiales bacterium]